jgi:hypothetical protein
MKFIPTAVVNKVGLPLLKLQKSSPQVMFVGGLVAGGAGVVLACRSTLKLSDTLSKAEEMKALAKDAFENGTDDGTPYTEKEYGKDQTVIKVQTLLSITKLYAPAAGLLMLSAALLTGSHVTLNKRNTAAVAAYAGVDEAFKNYRSRVLDKYGRDVDDELRYGAQVVEEKIVDEDGKTKTIKTKRVADGVPTQYARFFDELCGPHQRDPEINKIFLQSQQSYFNNLLQAKGYVFLNEVYKALDLPESKAGQVVGWVLGKGGDNYVDFGIFDNIANPEVRKFVDGREYSILLDFNVDGMILDHLKDL